MCFGDVQLNQMKIFTFLCSATYAEYTYFGGVQLCQIDSTVGNLDKFNSAECMYMYVCNVGMMSTANVFFGT